MSTRKFWCHYIGSDGNTPKRRSIELTNLADLIPAIGDNVNCKTPLWYEKETDNYNRSYYHFYAQLNDKVAVLIIQTGLSDTMLERVTKTNEQIDAFWKQWIERQWEQNPKNEVGKEKDIAYMKERSAQERKERDLMIERIKQLQNYDDVLINGSWIAEAAVRAYEEAQSPRLPVLRAIRKQNLAKREIQRKQREEQERLRREEEARKAKEAEAKEQERLTKEAEKFKNGESISGCDVVELCRKYGIAIHLRTVHNLQQVILNINFNGKQSTCQYYRQNGKRRPVLDGCYKAAQDLYNYLQAA